MKIDPKDCDRFICTLCTANQAKKAGEEEKNQEEKVGGKSSWLKKR